MQIDARTALKRLGGIRRDLERYEARQGQQMAADASRMAQAALNASVYGTVTGKYRRTRTLWDQLSVTPVPGGVLIHSRAPYAGFVERIDPSTVGLIGNSGQTRGLNGWNAESRTPPTYGRSGVAWFKPGPHVTPAALHALALARREVIRIVTRR